MKHYSKMLRALIAVATLITTWALHAADIEPPKVQVVDWNGVNMANGQVTHSLATVSIGGAMGLSHSVSVDANEFNFSGGRGFHDKYLGEARNVNIDPTGQMLQNILRVYDFTGTADFGYYVNGTLQQSGSGLTSGYTYVSMGDERQILETTTEVVNGNTVYYLKWTHPDGTVSRFYRGSTVADSYGLLTDVTYPNGFVIKVWAAGMSVTTNTGFQLKALYPPDYRLLGSGKPNLPQCTGDYNQFVPGSCLYNTPASYPSAYQTAHNLPNPWSTINPASIVGINNAFEYCTPTDPACTLTRKWPTATFNWPPDMPYTMYVGGTSMNVVDASGRKTIYNFTAYDLAYNGNTLVEGQVPGIQFSPRLSSFSTYGTPNRFTYAYKNIWATQSGGSAGGMSYGSFDVRLQSAGVVTQSTRPGVTYSYDMLEPYDGGVGYDVINIGGDVGRVQVHGRISGTVGALYYANTAEGTLNFEGSPRNFLVEFDNANGPQTNYSYTRGNLTTITYAQGQTNSTSVQASYPASCTTATRKTCNQANWIMDAKGNKTYYTYHAPSGQVATVTYPANKDGITPQTRYEYTQLSAYYYNGGSSKIAGSPIWMKTAERTCINSNPSNGINGGSCNGGDEVVTRYEYNNDNLLMTGMTVTDPTGKTLRTCYQYDIYGNQIGKTQPNANLSSCN